MHNGQTLSILTVCSRNRTRSILMVELMRRHVESLTSSHALPHVTLTSAGTAAEALAPIVGVPQQLRRFGITMAPHVGRQVTRELVDAADVIVVAEPEQVVWIAGRWSEAYARTFTLPELVSYLGDVGPRAGRPIEEWTLELAARRPRPQTYMTPQAVPGIIDPTGMPEDIWARVTNDIDDMASRFVRHALL
jgi:protein-tyrosine-phosphatase